MKRTNFLYLNLGLFLGTALTLGMGSVRAVPAGKFDYATIRWDGLEHSHIVRQGVNVQFLGGDTERLSVPKHADERAMVMNYAMMLLDREGYEFAGTSGDDIIMRRPSH